ncbi:MAG TPA: polyphosphate polymerase domain-containing protein, partial [Clostridiaceae bacterium]|nr:polyphosphate polymerase domain-containing protein [Clostridiaceae bacterium]
MYYRGHKFRHELKYYINYCDYLALRSRLKLLMKPDPNAGINGDYMIRSLYFDDLKDTALYEKAAGIRIRHKYRIRTYNLSDSVIKLERKNKVGGYINKESARLSRETVDALMRNDLVGLDTDDILIRDFKMSIMNDGLRPKVIVDYDREAYVCSFSDTRVTFDKELRVPMTSNDIFDASIPTEILVKMPRLIMEVKFNE